MHRNKVITTSDTAVGKKKEQSMKDDTKGERKYHLALKEPALHIIIFIAFGSMAIPSWPLILQCF